MLTPQTGFCYQQNKPVTCDIASHDQFVENIFLASKLKFRVYVVAAITTKQIECGLALSVLMSTTSTRHHSGQNVVDSRGAAQYQRQTNLTVN